MHLQIEAPYFLSDIYHVRSGKSWTYLPRHSLVLHHWRFSLFPHYELNQALHLLESFLRNLVHIDFTLKPNTSALEKNPSAELPSLILASTPFSKNRHWTVHLYCLIKPTKYLAALAIIRGRTYIFAFRGRVSNFAGSGVRKKVKCVAEFSFCSTMDTATPSAKQTTK